MATKKVQLKNIITEVPKDAVLLTDPIHQLRVGDFCLQIWDNPISESNLEINNRLFTQVLNLNEKEDRVSFGGHFGESKLYNATTCTGGADYPQRTADWGFPHRWFFIRHGTVQRPITMPNLYRNPGYDLMNDPY